MDPLESGKLYCWLNSLDDLINISDNRSSICSSKTEIFGGGWKKSKECVKRWSSPKCHGDSCWEGAEGHTPLNKIQRESWTKFRKKDSLVSSATPNSSLRTPLGKGSYQFEEVHWESHPVRLSQLTLIMRRRSDRPHQESRTDGKVQEVKVVIL